MSISPRGGLPVLVALAAMLVPGLAAADVRNYGGDARNSRLTEVLFRSIWTEGGHPSRIKAFQADHVDLYCSSGRHLRTGRSTQALPQLSGTPVKENGDFNGHMRAKEGRRVVHAHLKGTFRESGNADGWVHYRVDYLARGERPYKVCRSKRVSWKATD